ncbi:DUF1836 domain-containing protein [Lactiplantibacillus garii]|uniref:DUF1836 domain-containing protein n=1 Tax=Lactiplantibacillus garii TaxID=2306423 RepID=A0A426D7Q6_9LACO|nr:DUF1836 domain-containing protein [Lactiplantibacillus garii]RRK10649.1 DUF1836 domain-containing protein [Lactiplantibacillus garii]
MASETYVAWQARMEKVILPKWTELPNFDLYMDQVLLLINETLQPLGVDQVTAAMINNYVKHKVILAPVKKKYQIMQLADIIVISLLKPSYPLDQIRQGIDQVTATGYPKRAYDGFITALTNQLHHMDAPVTISDQDPSAGLTVAAAQLIVDKLRTDELLRLNQAQVKPQQIEK